jgi:hypothetical protein
MAITNIALADTAGGINIDFVSIGNAGNTADTKVMNDGTTGYGAVGYEYRIGKYEITNAQWNAFTSAAGAPTGNPADAYDQSATIPGDQQPTNYVSWYEALQFCNYLTSGDKSKGVYRFSGNNANPGDFLDIDQAAAQAAYGTIYFLPTEDEWYKAAYYKGDGSGYSVYTSGLNTKPVADNGWNYHGGAYSTAWNVGTGTMEQNGTFDMMGNVYEWNESLIGTFRGIRGGASNSSGDDIASWDRSALGEPFKEYGPVGFRVASLPTLTFVVEVDVKPGSCRNPFNVKSRGVLPVAILGSEEFDVSSIDAASIRLAGVAPIRSSYEDVATPVSDSEECECSTEGPDGFGDLTLKFETQEIVKALGEADHGDELVLELTGVLSDETPIEGGDCITIRGKHKPLYKADFNGDGIFDMADFTTFSENWLQSSIIGC